MRSLVTIVLAGVLMIPVASLEGQTEQSALVGARVRVTVPDTMRTGDQRTSPRPLVVVGTLVAVGDSMMRIRNDAATSDVTVPLARVQRFQVSTGTTRGASAATGGLVGLGVGGVLGYALGDDCTVDEFLCFSRQDVAVAGALAGAAIGGLIGLLAGSREHWRDTLVPARVSIVPTGARSLFITSTLRF